MRAYFIAIRLIILILLSTGCEADYDIDKHFKDDFKPRVVLNSIISPDRPIVVELFWSKHYSDTTDYKKVESFEVELYEDGNLIESFQCKDGLLSTKISPQDSKTYTLQITVPSYGMVRATTTIPNPVTSTLEYIKLLEVDPNNNGLPYRFSHFKLTGISSVAPVRAIWIMAEAFCYTGAPANIWSTGKSIYLYSDNQFTDKANAREDIWCLEAKGSHVTYSQFLRVSYANFSKALPLDFSIEATGQYEDQNLSASDPRTQKEITIIPATTIVSIISPSIDYDKYQQSYTDSFYTDPFGSGSSLVYSNVENGVGIFAGYTTSVYQIDVKR